MKRTSSRQTGNGWAVGYSSQQQLLGAFGRSWGSVESAADTFALCADLMSCWEPSYGPTTVSNKALCSAKYNSSSWQHLFSATISACGRRDLESVDQVSAHVLLV